MVCKQIQDLINRWQQQPNVINSNLYDTCVIARLKNNEDGTFVFDNAFSALLEQNFYNKTSEYITVLQSIAMLNTIILQQEDSMSIFDKKQLTEKATVIMKYLVPILEKAMTSNFDYFFEYWYLGYWCVLPREATLCLELFSLLKRKYSKDAKNDISSITLLKLFERIQKILVHLSDNRKKDLSLKNNHGAIKKLCYLAEAILPFLDDNDEFKYFLSACQKSVDKLSNVSSSSSATAQYYVYSKDERALQFLKEHQNQDNMFSEFTDLKGFEIAWMIFYFVRANIDVEKYFISKDNIKKIFDLSIVEKDGYCGLGGLDADCDTTSVIIFNSINLGITSNFDYTIYDKWKNENNNSYDTFLTKSRNVMIHISTNVHTLIALLADPNLDFTYKLKEWDNILSLLEKYCGLFFDTEKIVRIQECWHRSVYYPFSDIIYLITKESHQIFFGNRKTELHTKIIDYFIETQNVTDGGYSNIPGSQSTLEETAFVVLALVEYLTYYEKNNKNIITDDNVISILRVVSKAVEFLKMDPYGEKQNPIPLWTSRTLYYPVYISQSIILSALHSWHQFLKVLPQHNDIGFELFSYLPYRDVIYLLKKSHKKDNKYGLSCCLPWNGTTRYEVFENVGKQELLENMFNFFGLMFNHGIKFLLIPILVDFLLDNRGEQYVKYVKQAFPSFAGEFAMNFYHENNIRVIAYGDYENGFQKYKCHELIDVFKQLEHSTKHNTRCVLLFGLFSNKIVDATINVTTEYIKKYLQLHDPETPVSTLKIQKPQKQDLIKEFYQVNIDPISIFIATSKTNVTNPPLLEKDLTDYYFTVAPHPYMQEKHIRLILFDHLFFRSGQYNQILSNFTSSSNNKNLSNERDRNKDISKEKAKSYYQENLFQIFGLQKKKFNHHCPNFTIKE